MIKEAGKRLRVKEEVLLLPSTRSNRPKDPEGVGQKKVLWLNHFMKQSMKRSGLHSTKGCRSRQVTCEHLSLQEAWSLLVAPSSMVFTVLYHSIISVVPSLTLVWIILDHSWKYSDHRISNKPWKTKQKCLGKCEIKRNRNIKWLPFNSPNLHVVKRFQFDPLVFVYSLKVIELMLIILPWSVKVYKWYWWQNLDLKVSCTFSCML